MALGLRGQIRRLAAQLDEENRYVDISARFVSYDKNGGILAPTGDYSPIYGGKFDTWAQCYVGNADTVIDISASPCQLDLVLDDTPRIEANGGRGSGKSEGGVLKAIRNILERPGEPGQIVSPTAKLTTIIWNKMLAQTPRDWLLAGKQGIRLNAKELHFINGTVVRFASANNPDALRSWGGGWSFLDEEQDIVDLALDIVWPSLRLSDRPQMWTCGTPKWGMYMERHKRVEADDGAVVHRFSSFQNPYIPHEVFEVAKRQMDEKTYRQEILAEWVFREDIPLVFWTFNRDKHTVNNLSGFAKDVTQAVTLKRTGKRAKYIVGVDYNWDYPNYAILYKIMEPNYWVAVDVISSKGHAGHLGKAIKEHGYKPKELLVVDDASGRYNRGPKSSSRLLRAEGFSVFHPPRNPKITDRIDATLCKLAPMSGSPTWFCLLPACEELAECMESLTWSKSGNNKLDKSTGHDHCIDAATYPIHFFEPPANLQIPRLSGIMAA